MKSRKTFNNRWTDDVRSERSLNNYMLIIYSNGYFFGCKKWKVAKKSLHHNAIHARIWTSTRPINYYRWEMFNKCSFIKQFSVEKCTAIKVFNDRWKLDLYCATFLREDKFKFCGMRQQENINWIIAKLMAWDWTMIITRVIRYCTWNKLEVNRQRSGAEIIDGYSVVIQSMQLQRQRQVQHTIMQLSTAFVVSLQVFNFNVQHSKEKQQENKRETAKVDTWMNLAQWSP